MFCTTQRGSWMSSGFPDAGVCVCMILGAGGLKNSPQKTLRKKEPFSPKKEVIGIWWTGQTFSLTYLAWTTRMTLSDRHLPHIFGCQRCACLSNKKNDYICQWKAWSKKSIHQVFSTKTIATRPKKRTPPISVQIQEPMSRAKYANMIAL